MKKLMFVLVVLALLVLPSTTMAGGPTGFDCEGNEIGWDYSTTCTNIQSGELYTTDGEQLTIGFSDWGYNYQGHVFSGDYCDYHPIYRPGGIYHDWCIANYGDVNMLMKWNEQWMSNEDCSGDGLLDRHRGFDSYIGSGAWETNQMSGEYIDDEGNTCVWNYFTKIVAAPADAYTEDGIWYTVDDVKIGEVIWGEFAVTMEVENDTCTGDHGFLYQSPAGVGFGPWQ